jgi:hypothetical protein
MLTLIRSENLRNDSAKSSCHVWHVKCDCGVSRVIRSGYFYKIKSFSDSTANCGCMTSKLKADAHRTHGLAGQRKGVPRDARYVMWHSAKARSKNIGVPFDILPEEMPVIPKLCPLLGVPMVAGQGPNGAKSDFSPSLDRIFPEKGYVKGNIQVISDKANRMKNSASFEEFELAYLNWKAFLEKDQPKC